MLTVWCVFNGFKYKPEDVYTLRRMVEKNLTTPHRFKCLADRPISGIDCVIPEECWPGWWSKLLLFKYGSGQCLYLDLDVVIVGELQPLLSDQLSMPANWAQSGHGGCQSSVMSWNGFYPALYKDFDVMELTKPSNGNCGYYKGLWGDQEYITSLYGAPGELVRPMSGVYSYKYHCRKGPPKDARVICFHGQPKPGDVSDSWVIRSRSMFASA